MLQSSVERSHVFCHNLPRFDGVSTGVAWSYWIVVKFQASPFWVIFWCAGGVYIVVDNCWYLGTII